MPPADAPVCWKDVPPVKIWPEKASLSERVSWLYLPSFTVDREHDHEQGHEQRDHVGVGQERRSSAWPVVAAAAAVVDRPLAGRHEGEELVGDDAGDLARLDGEDALQGHGPQLHLSRESCLSLFDTGR